MSLISLEVNITSSKGLFIISPPPPHKVHAFSAGGLHSQSCASVLMALHSSEASSNILGVSFAIAPQFWFCWRKPRLSPSISLISLFRLGTASPPRQSEHGSNSSGVEHFLRWIICEESVLYVQCDVDSGFKNAKWPNQSNHKSVQPFFLGPTITVLSPARAALPVGVARKYRAR